MTSNDTAEEFKQALSEICCLAPSKIDSSFDRVRIVEWISKLVNFPLKNNQKLYIHNEYAQYLRIMLLSDTPFIAFPFKKRPPKQKLAPLMEILGNAINTKWINLPKTCPIQPVICNKSDDGKAFMAVKRCPDGGILCYMAVTPNSLSNGT